MLESAYLFGGDRENSDIWDKRCINMQKSIGKTPPATARAGPFPAISEVPSLDQSAFSQKERECLDGTPFL